MQKLDLRRIARGKVAGSLTIEATIAFTIFLSFMVMLLMLVRLSTVAITLDTVTAESAKVLATSYYPLGLFNDMADKQNDKLEVVRDPQKFVDAGVKQTGDTLTGFLFNSKTEAGKDWVATSNMLDLAFSVADYPVAALGELLEDKWLEFSGQIGAQWVMSQIATTVEENKAPIDLDNLEMTIFKTPVPDYVYEDMELPECYEQMGLAKEDFGAEDVIIGLTYDYTISLPFFPSFDVQLKSMSMERGWLNGGNSQTLEENEGISIEKALTGDKKLYYVGAGGNSKCYHRASCPYLWRGKKIWYAADVKAAGLKPCTSCKPAKVK